jgi:ribonuclease HII
VLTDGFPVRGLGAPALAVWKGDRVTASVAAASVVAKVSRDRMMRDLHERYPQYGFDRHKGYNTDEHERALAEHGPCPVHRYSFVNVNRVAAQDNHAPSSQAGDDQARGDGPRSAPAQSNQAPNIPARSGPVLAHAIPPEPVDPMDSVNVMDSVNPMDYVNPMDAMGLPHPAAAPRL